MFCEHCGKELVDPDLFCEHCGKPLPEDAVKRGGTDLLKAVGLLVWAWVKRYKIVLIAVLALAALVTGGFMVADYMKTVINPVDYLSVQLSGYHSGGTAQIVFDEDHTLMYRLMGLGPEELEALDAAYETEETKLAALFYLAMLAEENSDLNDIFEIYSSRSQSDGKISNGDIVSVAITVNQDLLETYGLHTLKKEYAVEYKIGTDTPKLPEPTTMDLFSHVKLSAEGPEGYGKLYVRAPEKPVALKEPINGVHSFHVEYKDGSGWGNDYLLFHLLDENGEEVRAKSIAINANDSYPSRMKNLVNGDTIAVSTGDAAELEACGIFLTNTEKTVAVDNLRQMEQIDLLSILEYEFCGPEGYGYFRFLPGTYQVPVSYSGDGKKELTIQVAQDPEDDFYDEYYWAPHAVLTFAVSPAEGVSENIRIKVHPEPYGELKAGDKVNYKMSYSSEHMRLLKESGYTLKEDQTVTVPKLMNPVMLKLSDILDYSVSWDELDENEWDLQIGSTRTTSLPENELGIQELTTTLRKENENSTTAYIVTFAFTTTDDAGKTEDHSIDCEINISRDKYYKTVKFEMIREKYRDLWQYGLAIENTYERFSVSRES